MEPTLSIWQSPAITTLIGAAGTILGVLIGARVQRGHGRELERDRFRHDIAARTADERLKVHIGLSSRVAEAYRAKMNNAPDRQAKLDSAKNYYYDNRFFFSHVLGKAFRGVDESLSLATPRMDILNDNINDLYNTIRDDLLLRDLADSVDRAVTGTP